MKRFRALLCLVVMPILVAALCTATASANTITRTFTTISGTFFDAPAAANCGFPLYVTINGSFKQTNYVDNTGRLVKSIITDVAGPFTLTITNPATGKSVTSQSAPIAEILTFNPDGSLASDTINGAFFNYVARGVGTILIRTGRLVYDGSGNLIFEAGPHDFTGQDYAPFCAYIADP